MEGKKVVDFCIQVVKTLVSQGYARSDRYGVDWFSASRGLVCYRRAGREDSCFSRICKARSLQCGSVPASRCLN